MARRIRKPTAESVIGKHLLVGITRMNPDGTVRKQVQMHGTIIAVDDQYLTMRLNDSDELCTLPPETDRLIPADPGEYTLRSTGEVVVNPDLLAYWTVGPPGTVDVDDDE